MIENDELRDIILFHDGGYNTTSEVLERPSKLLRGGIPAPAENRWHIHSPDF